MGETQKRSKKISGHPYNKLRAFHIVHILLAIIEGTKYAHMFRDTRKQANGRGITLIILD